MQPKHLLYKLAGRNTFSMLIFLPTAFLLSLLVLSTYYVMRISTLSAASAAAWSLTSAATSCKANTTVDLNWYPPVNWNINNLTTVINGTGIYGFIFNSSQGPLNTYNWCNMPHVNPKTYPRAPQGYELSYVEVIHRHHKRTPYASNTFPTEGYSWDCSDEGLFYGGAPLNPTGNRSAETYWSVFTSPSNPFAPQGFNGTCQFPQITRGGLDDSHQHGLDLKAVYSDMLGFIPQWYDSNRVSYRVTNNVITSQVASMLVAGMYPALAGQTLPLKIQPASIDSLEPTYSCPTASSLYSSYGSGSSSSAWKQHLTASEPLYARLDALSGVSPTNSGWHNSWDHYFDSLSARLCHNKPLPCSISNPSDCVSLKEADEVFRLGEYEYSFIYRDAPQSLSAARGSYGVWIAELSSNLKEAMGSSSYSTSSIRYRHNVAHDGSISRILSILQLSHMVWPGMGSEIVFELYRKGQCYFLRVLWSGHILVSSHPALGKMDMIPIETVLTYFDGLAGVNGSLMPGLCGR
ncbi:Hypothetical protein R9X50_00475400 [Acrodontium crateriforme]|uniref:Uncharacterized protein n=1 Tax=Acrodontium crateriforme TaxID=150365 RepID=A0AAQ3M5W6_9PEZI|nr:Hypothetical protein R9X50_00475400 [Acrodontium crateriforme]